MSVPTVPPCLRGPWDAPGRKVRPEGKDTTMIRTTGS